MLDNIDNYVSEGFIRLSSPEQFRKEINVAYPSGNKPIFEEWFINTYIGSNTDRILIDIPFTSYWVNNDYGANQESRTAIQNYVDKLPNDRKYFCIVQYDDGCMVDWKGKDVLEFNMSKTNGVMLPLTCQPHPYKFKGGKKWLASFVGSRTHPIRNELEKLKDKEGFYISYEPHDIEIYCRILHESIFTLCPRGYGLNSFRIAEALQYGSIPVYISDDFIYPFGIDFHDFGVVVNSRHVHLLEEILTDIQPEEIIRKQDKLKEIYDKYYTYEGCLKQIIKSLETEYHNRKQG